MPRIDYKIFRTSIFKIVAEWLIRYILATIIILGATFAGVWLFAMLTRGNFSNILYWVMLGEDLLLIFIGIASGLSTSEYAYIRRGAINPTVMRAGMEYFKRGPEKHGMGILLGAVGLTIIFVWFIAYSAI
ncbi:MAG: hypothetical protein ACUVT5_05565 [Candidatus Bathyarchaeales archaeon]